MTKYSGATQFNSAPKNPGVVPLDLAVTVTVPANTPLYTPLQATILNDPTNGNQSEVKAIAPPDETWQLDSVYASNSTALASLDGYITFNANGKPTNAQFGPLSNTLPSIQNPIGNATGVTVQPNGSAQAFLLPSLSLTTTATVAFNVRFKRIPAGYKGIVPS